MKLKYDEAPEVLRDLERGHCAKMGSEVRRDVTNEKLGCDSYVSP